MIIDQGRGFDRARPDRPDAGMTVQDVRQLSPLLASELCRTPSVGNDTGISLELLQGALDRIGPRAERPDHARAFAVGTALKRRLQGDTPAIAGAQAALGNVTDVPPAPVAPVAEPLPAPPPPPPPPPPAPPPPPPPPAIPAPVVAAPVYAPAPVYVPAPTPIAAPAPLVPVKPAAVTFRDTAKAAGMCAMVGGAFGLGAGLYLVGDLGMAGWLAALCAACAGSVGNGQARRQQEAINVQAAARAMLNGGQAVVTPNATQPQSWAAAPPLPAQSFSPAPPATPKAAIANMKDRVAQDRATIKAKRAKLKAIATSAPMHQLGRMVYEDLRRRQAYYHPIGIVVLSLPGNRMHGEPGGCAFAPDGSIHQYKNYGWEPISDQGLLALNLDHIDAVMERLYADAARGVMPQSIRYPRGDFSWLKRKRW